jgi:hypothetical protein
MRRLRTIAVLAVGASAGLLVWRGLPASSPPPAPAADVKGDADPHKTTKWMGVATCSAMGCHHANGPLGRPKGSEYSIWSAHDRHTRAYAVLSDDPRSEPMVRNLYGSKAKPAAKTELCLKCHAMNNGKEDEATVGERFYIGDGVGCESCHGPAENYLSEHYRDGFKEKSWKEKEAYGLWNTVDLASRARICASCHVGTADKDVNHDLIAAGHPRLNFEFSGFLAIYPKHWRLEEDEEQVWAVGQVATAAASLRLLQARASKADKPWPEFAEYDCYACHKDLRADLPGGDKKRLLGSLPWGSWYFAVLDPLAAELKQSGISRDQLRHLMQAPASSREKVSAEAARLAELLEQWAQGGLTVKGQADALIKRLAVFGQTEALDWEKGTQLYLAMEALGQALPDKDFVRPELMEIRKTLKCSFQKGYDSPRLFTKDAREAVADQLRRISEKVK